MLPFIVIVLSIVVVYAIIRWIFKEKPQEDEISTTKSEKTEILNIVGPPKLREIPWSNELIFILNGVQIRLINPNPTELLATYIRDKAGLKGTKLGCEEGGCGACTVVLTKPEGTISVNSCLRPLCANDGYSITTVEGIGSVSAGLSSEQQSIVEEHGTQCGFCTPGWITNMHALNTSIAESNGTNPTGREIDAYFDGNICRCTGYRPILKAFKKNCTPEDCSKCPHAGTSSCKDHQHEHEDHHHYHIAAVEDLGLSKISPTSITKSSIKKRSIPLGKKRQELLTKNYSPSPLHFTGYNTHWYRPVDLSQLCAILHEYQNLQPTYQIQLVGGNTSIGVTKYFNETAPYNTQDYYNVFIDINLIPELTVQSYDSTTRSLLIGATTTLTELIQLLYDYSNKRISHEVNMDENLVNHESIFAVTAHHLRKIANTQVRNAGTWAGNLGIFLKHSTFPSDVALSFTTAYALLTICDLNGLVRQVTMDEFLQFNSTNHQFLILNVLFKESSPPSSSFSPSPSSYLFTSNDQKQTIAVTFKICIREHNAHAQVNAGFNYEISYDQDYQTKGPLCHQARVVYGGVSNKTFIAYRTQEILKGSRITSNTLQEALLALQLDLDEIGISSSYGSAEYRYSVMNSCFYRSLLQTYQRNEIPLNLRSAVDPFVKLQSRGREFYTVVDNNEPIHLPIPKLEAMSQATGEAVYPSDETLPPQGLSAAIVFTSQCACILSDIDPSAALSLPGVVAFFNAKDIPGENMTSMGLPLYLPIGEEVPCIGMPVGIIVAITDEIASHAASLVNLVYSSCNKIPITNLSQAISQKSFYDLPPIPGMTLLQAGDAESAMKTSPRRVKGSFSASGQSHFYMETQSSVASFVNGDILEITCGTQDLTTFQNQIINVLGMTASQIQVKCSRTGGGFGGKLTGGIIETVSTALATYLVKRPVRIFNSRTSDMYLHSGRDGYFIQYEIGFDNDGKILALIYDLYCDAGCSKNDCIGCVTMSMRWAENAFYLPNYLARATLCYTNTPPRTYARAPGLVQSCLATSVVIERIASELKLDEEYVKSINFLQDGLPSICGQVITNSTLNRCWDTLLRRSRYHQRLTAIQEYNSKNLWRKRGISIEPVKYGIGYAYYNAGCQIGIFKSDGTVTVAHNGVEMGQGINTKVVQVIAAELGLDISLIRVTSSSTTRIANGGTTGGSGTSEVCCQAAIQACRILNSRLLPFKQQYPEATWLELLSQLPPDVSLNAEGWYSPAANPNQEEFQYYVWGACVSEISYDVLSGMIHVISSDLLYDCGLSLNPYIDLGQIEGAYMMGLGYILQERVDYNDMGLLESIGTWEYKPPLAQDIPSIFNITLLSCTPNKAGILRSKAVGEPAIVLANSLYFATKMAIKSCRSDAGVEEYFTVDAPLTIDIRQTSSLVNSSRFVMPI